ncbi:hypothetical protein [Methylocystis parvus]|uniref:Uncharacterized protein n=1 Tax=Methylocystis parvus TaxID=134 RepID=A0A6B8M8U8_9HYPH|nr:hypothetical protein [Methylocystis parvus]QGM99211.1 hypothetical protein F7D14_18125 [Methylocystis parvus]WBK00408.1 hypothetical protein MMG94_01405 [Methylocystis parvus OBBP]
MAAGYKWIENYSLARLVFLRKQVGTLPASWDVSTVDPGQRANGSDIFATEPGLQAFLGCGPADKGPGSFYWVWDDGNNNIKAQLWGHEPVTLVTLRGGGIIPVIVLYNRDGTLAMRQA